MRDPKVYLFDEPLSNLDAALRVATRIEIAQLKESMPESTMIYVTHDQVEAMTLASSHRGLGRRRDCPGRHASATLRTAGKRVRRTVHRLACHEPAAGQDLRDGCGRPASSLPTGAKPCRTLPSLPEDSGKDVNIGVRPEDFVATDGPQIFKGTVSISEALGEVHDSVF